VCINIYIHLHTILLIHYILHYTTHTHTHTLNYSILYIYIYIYTHTHTHIYPILLIYYTILQYSIVCVCIYIFYIYVYKHTSYILYFCLLHDKFHASMQLSPSCEAGNFSDGQKIPSISWNTEIYYIYIYIYIYVTNINIHMYVYQVTRRKSDCRRVILRDPRVTTPCLVLLHT
jgi:hypothetical protein